MITQKFHQKILNFFKELGVMNIENIVQYSNYLLPQRCLLKLLTKWCWIRLIILNYSLYLSFAMFVLILKFSKNILCMIIQLSSNLNSNEFKVTRISQNTFPDHRKYYGNECFWLWHVCIWDSRPNFLSLIVATFIWKRFSALITRPNIDNIRRFHLRLANWRAQVKQGHSTSWSEFHVDISCEFYWLNKDLIRYSRNLALTRIYSAGVCRGYKLISIIDVKYNELQIEPRFFFSNWVVESNFR